LFAEKESPRYSVEQLKEMDPIRRHRLVIDNKDVAMMVVNDPGLRLLGGPSLREQRDDNGKWQKTTKRASGGLSLAQTAIRYHLEVALRVLNDEKLREFEPTKGRPLIQYAIRFHKEVALKSLDDPKIYMLWGILNGRKVRMAHVAVAAFEEAAEKAIKNEQILKLYDIRGKRVASWISEIYGIAPNPADKAAPNILRKKTADS
jgi:phosphoenolpyruvate synthase/pyruvate phosphate dikinase